MSFGFGAPPLPLDCAPGTARDLLAKQHGKQIDKMMLELEQFNGLESKNLAKKTKKIAKSKHFIELSAKIEPPPPPGCQCMPWKNGDSDRHSTLSVCRVWMMLPPTGT